MAITREEVLHVAKLARLELTEDEIERLTGELSAILQAVSKVSQLDLSDVPPTSHPLAVVNAWAEDEPGAPRRAHEPQEGPVYGHGEVPLEPAKAQLLELLRERGARSAVIVYEGGNDEGWITTFEYSTVALGADPADWSGESLPDAQAVDVDAAMEAAGGPDDALFEAAEAVMCDKWGSFAGEFEVEGRLVIDVDSSRIVRRDVVRVEEGPAGTEVE